MITRVLRKGGGSQGKEEITTVTYRAKGLGLEGS